MLVILFLLKGSLQQKKYFHLPFLSNLLQFQISPGGHITILRIWNAAKLPREEGNESTIQIQKEIFSNQAP